MGQHYRSETFFYTANIAPATPI